MEKEKETEKKKKKQGEKEVLQFYIYKLPIDRPAAVTGTTANFGLLRDPSFWQRAWALLCRALFFELFSNLVVKLTLS